MMAAVSEKFRKQYDRLSKLRISEVNASFTATQVKEMRTAVETMFTFMAQFRDGKSTDIASVFLSVVKFIMCNFIGKELKGDVDVKNLQLDITHLKAFLSNVNVQE